MPVPKNSRGALGRQETATVIFKVTAYYAMHDDSGLTCSLYKILWMGANVRILYMYYIYYVPAFALVERRVYRIPVHRLLPESYLQSQNQDCHPACVHTCTYTIHNSRN